MLEIPLQAVPAQTVSAVLAGQNVRVTLNQRARGLFATVELDGVTAAANTIARDAVPLISREYVGFVGNLFFVDTQGKTDPDSTGLGSRYSLIYLDAAEYALF